MAGALAAWAASLPGADWMLKPPVQPCATVPAIRQLAIGLVRLRQCRFHLGQASFQHGVFVGESVRIHGVN